jgi:hypothetical protein
MPAQDATVKGAVIGQPVGAEPWRLLPIGFYEAAPVGTPGDREIKQLLSAAEDLANETGPTPGPWSFVGWRRSPHRIGFVLSNGVSRRRRVGEVEFVGEWSRSRPIIDRRFRDEIFDLDRERWVPDGYAEECAAPRDAYSPRGTIWTISYSNGAKTRETFSSGHGAQTERIWEDGRIAREGERRSNGHGGSIYEMRPFPRMVADDGAAEIVIHCVDDGPDKMSRLR